MAPDKGITEVVYFNWLFLCCLTGAWLGQHIVTCYNLFAALAIALSDNIFGLVRIWWHM